VKEEEEEDIFVVWAPFEISLIKYDILSQFIAKENQI